MRMLNRTFPSSDVARSRTIPASRMLRPRRLLRTLESAVSMRTWRLSDMWRKLMGLTPWIIVGLIVAVAVVAVILVSGGSDGGGIY